MFVLSNSNTGKSVELTPDELDAIFSALSDYQDYGDNETELAFSIQSKLMEV